MLQAIDGQAIDRHLLGMKLIAIENCIEVPSLYKDASYSKANNWRVSTSQVGKCANKFLFKATKLSAFFVTRVNDSS